MTNHEVTVSLVVRLHAREEAADELTAFLTNAVAAANALLPGQGPHVACGYAVARSSFGATVVLSARSIAATSTSSAAQAWRRRGVARALVEGVLVDGARLGVRTAMLQPTPAAQRLYESLEFEPVRSKE